jgi:hypothetical protein
MVQIAISSTVKSCEIYCASGGISFSNFVRRKIGCPSAFHFSKSVTAHLENSTHSLRDSGDGSRALERPSKNGGPPAALETLLTTGSVEICAKLEMCMGTLQKPATSCRVNVFSVFCGMYEIRRPLRDNNRYTHFCRQWPFSHVTGVEYWHNRFRLRYCYFFVTDRFCCCLVCVRYLPVGTHT